MPKDRDVRRRSRSVERRRRRSRSDSYEDKRSRRRRRSISPDDRRRRRRSRSKSYEERRRRSRSRSYERKKKRRRTRSRSKSPKRDVKREMHSIPLRERKRLLSISSTSSEEERFDEHIETLRKEKSEKRKLDKQRIKETETAEEKRIRRLAKKMKKEENKKLESLSNAIAYNNLNNPFNDTNLTDPFVWKKKMEKDGTKPLTKKELDDMHYYKVKKNLKEMEELRRNRQSRQEAKEELEKFTREKEKELYGDYSVIEYKFHIKQAKERTKIRIKENRAKPIDLLARYSVFGIPEEEEQYGDFELVDPTQYIKDLAIDDLEDLIADIKVFKKINDYKDDAFWDDMRTICEGELEKLKDVRKRREMDEAVHSSVRDDVLNKFKGKTYQQLVEMQNSLKETIRINPGNGFYQVVFDQLLPYMARQRIKEKHREKMALKLKRIREEQAKEMDEHSKQFGDIKPEIIVSQKEEESKEETVEEEMEITEEDAVAMQKQALKSIQFTLEELLQLPDEEQEQKWSSLKEQQLKAFTENIYELGRYSPTLDKNAMPGIEIIEENDDKKQLEEMRKQGKLTGDANPMTAEERRLMQTYGGMEQDEENFNDEVVEKQTYLWSDKYRPRKPKYLNRVHTGFDWNKYNQTHYDLDNPPPKIVQGYRFNIFYPDLLDVTQTPSYTITECEDPDFALIKFKAGPPYEDVAFKIVNREWEINHKHGFKNQFKDGVFQLWFFFKRYRYRR